MDMSKSVFILVVDIIENPKYMIIHTSNEIKSNSFLNYLYD